MNIIYFTTAQDINSFNDYLSLWNTPFNASNQTFHNKLIRSLSLSNQVEVVSIRPFSRQKCSISHLSAAIKKEENINWNYLRVIGGKLNSVISFKKQIKALFKTFPRNSIIITDTINPTVLYLSTYFAKKNKMPIIGVCTDSPSNIAGTTRTYTLLLLSLAKNLDGYIALTTGLNELYNEQEKPCFILEGLVEDCVDKKQKSEYGKYIFYCGALSERYGLYQFIDFYKTYVKGDTKFVFCGHHADNDKIHQAIDDDPRIVYLGNLPNKDVLELEVNAWCNINPRPFSEDLDRFSIPSKVLEFLNSGTPLISVKNTKLQKYFNANAIWIKSNSQQDFIEGFQKLNTFTDAEINRMVKDAQDLVQKHYSLTSVNNKLEGFLYLFALKRSE